MSGENSSRKQLRQQRLKASARRDSFDRQLTNHNSPNNLDYKQEKGSQIFKTFFLSLLSTFAFLGAIIYGSPIYGENWNSLALLIALSVLILVLAESVRTGKNITILHRTWIALFCSLITIAFFMGAYGQVVIEGKAYWRGSTTAQTYNLATKIRSDLYLLQTNQSLLAYPTEQARGISSLFVTAAKQAESVSLRWNPAIAPKDLPLPGFLLIYQHINQSAELQRQSLLGYIRYLEQPDTRLAQEIDEAKAKSEQLYLQAAIELASIVRPLGIDITKQVD
jgi:hypothetical protein